MVGSSFPITRSHVGRLPPKIKGDTTVTTTPLGKGRASSPSQMPGSRLPTILTADQYPNNPTNSLQILPWNQSPKHQFQSRQLQTPPSAPYIPVFTMADPTTSTPTRFVTNTETLEDVLKTQTIGLVHLSEFKKRCVKLAERSDRDAAEKTATDLPQLRRRLGTCELVSGS